MSKQELTHDERLMSVICRYFSIGQIKYFDQMVALDEKSEDFKLLQFNLKGNIHFTAIHPIDLSKELKSQRIISQ